MALLAVSFQQAGFLDASAPAHLGRFTAQLFPPDLSPAFLAGVIEPLWQTVAISVVGTAIGIALGAVLALPAPATPVLDHPPPCPLPSPALLRAAYPAPPFLPSLF